MGTVLHITGLGPAAALPMPADLLPAADEAPTDFFAVETAGQTGTPTAILLMAQARRFRSAARDDGLGGVNRSGGGDNNGGKPCGADLPFFHLSRFRFVPRASSPANKLADQKFLEVACRRLGSVISDVILVVGHPLVVSRKLSNHLAGPAARKDPEGRFAELTAQARGSILDAAFGIGAGEGWTVIRLSQGTGSGLYSKRRYVFYQREGLPIEVTYENRGEGDAARRRFYVPDPRLQKILWDAEREIDRVRQQEVLRWVEQFYREAGSPGRSETFISFFQGYALLLEAQQSDRYPAEFFTALWRLIYQVRLSRRPLPGMSRPVAAQESYRAVRSYLESASAAS